MGGVELLFVGCLASQQHASVRISRTKEEVIVY